MVRRLQKSAVTGKGAKDDPAQKRGGTPLSYRSGLMRGASSLPFLRAQKTASQQGEGGRLRYWRVGCAGCREGDRPIPPGGEAEGAHGSVEARSGEIGRSAEHCDGNSADHQVRRR